MTKFGGGLLDDVQIKCQGYRPCGFRQEYFQSSPYVNIGIN